VARVHLPARVPLGFHGNWIADTDTNEPPGRCRQTGRPVVDD
jgi:hypothetical protein